MQGLDIGKKIVLPVYETPDTARALIAARDDFADYRHALCLAMSVQKSVVTGPSMIYMHESYGHMEYMFPSFDQGKAI